MSEIEPTESAETASEAPSLEPPPDPNQVLTDAFGAAIAPFWVDPVECPVCKQTTWEIGFAGDLVQRYVPGKVLTFIPVRCTTCQHTIFFNGVGLGLFNPDGTPKGIESVANEARQAPEPESSQE